MSTNGEKLFGINKLESNVIFQRDIDNGEKGGIKGKGKKCLGGNTSNFITVKISFQYCLLGKMKDSLVKH